jgi:hypothetical protein
LFQDRFKSEPVEDEQYFLAVLRLSDMAVKDLIKSLSGIAPPEGFKQLDRQTRNSYLKELKEKGASIRQISRITGINRGAIEKI